MNETKEAFEIDLIQLVKAMLKKWWMLVLPALAGAILMFSYTTLFVTPLYKSTAKMYINPSNAGSVDMGSLSTARDLTDSYVYLIKNTRGLLDEVVAKTGLGYSYEQLRGMVSVSSGGNTEFLEISVKAANPADACLITNQIAQSLKGYASKIGLAPTSDDVQIVDQATVARSPSSPNTSRNMMMGFLIGFVLGAAFVVFKEIFDDKVQSEKWLKQAFKDEIPLLATIPSTERTERKNDRYARYSNYYRHYSSGAKASDKKAGR